MPRIAALSPPPPTEQSAPAAGAFPDNATVAPAEAQAATRPAYQKYAVEVRASLIDGQGAFAAEPIATRRKIGEIRGESISVAQARIRATRSERIMIVELSPKRAIDFTRSADPMRYTNHSCAPNARLCIRQGRVEFYALRDIPVGEEITVNYGETHHEGRLACRCGAPGCVGRL
jgi:SET domain-containing protein